MQDTAGRLPHAIQLHPIDIQSMTESERQASMSELYTTYSPQAFSEVSSPALRVVESSQRLESKMLDAAVAQDKLWSRKLQSAMKQQEQEEAQAKGTSEATTSSR